MTIKQSLKIDYDQMIAVTKDGGNIKGVRKLIQDKLKEDTGVRGYWTVWFEGELHGQYLFKIDNPLYLKLKAVRG